MGYHAGDFKARHGAFFQAGDFESKVARHGAVQIKSQPALDGTFVAPHSGLSPGVSLP